RSWLLPGPKLAGSGNGHERRRGQVDSRPQGGTGPRTGRDRHATSNERRETMKFLPAALSNRAAQHMLKLEKGSPKILFGVGVISMVGSTVMACRATLKLEEVLEQTNSNLHIADSLQHRDYSEEDRQKDKTVIYSRAAVDIAKLYGPSVVLGVAGIMCLTKSHNMLEQRYAAVSAAYVALDKGFREYRA